MDKQKIKLQPEFIKKVISGDKTATTRKGVKKVTLGQAVLVNPYDENDFVDILIEQISLLSWKQLQYRNSYLYSFEGFSSKEEYFNCMEKIYGPMERNQVLTVIYFKKLNTSTSIE